jgi:hypothetical protein
MHNPEPQPDGHLVTGKLHLCDTPQLRPQLWIFSRAPRRMPSLSRPRPLRKQVLGANRPLPALKRPLRTGRPPLHQAGRSSQVPRQLG